MSYRLYNSGNVLVFVDTAHTDKNGDTQFWIQKLPKNKTWYSYDNTAAPILYSVYYDNPERDLIIDAEYTSFQYKDGSSFSSDAELIAYLDNILGIGNSNYQVAYGDSPSIDSFARLRVSNPETIFDSKQIFDNAPLFWDDQETSGGGTSSTYSANRSSSTIAVSLNTAGVRVRQTFMRFNYQPGKSQLILMTGTLGITGGGTGIKRCMGIYDDDNGILMQDDEGVVKAIIRSSTTGSVVDTKVSQSDWNRDKLDGTGQSGITLDATKSQILIIDYEWLGVGRVRIGFVFDGIPVYCHQFLHANYKEGVYMTTPNLPLRYEIQNDGTGVASDLECICSSLMSEGGTHDNGVLRHKDSGAISGLSTGTTYALIGIRLQSGKLDGVVKLVGISCLATTTNDKAHWSIQFNPTVAGTFTYSDETNSVVQTATGSSSNEITNGLETDGGYFSTAQAAIASVPNALRIGSAIDGTVDQIILCVRPITNNITVESSLTWREIS